MKPTILASVLAPVLGLAACATDEPADELDITLTSTSDGKADAINGKQIRVQTGVRDFVFQDRETVPELPWDVSNVVVATDATVVVQANYWGFEGSDEYPGLADSPWHSDKLLELSLETPPDGARMGFLLHDKLWKRDPYTCVRGTTRLNIFDTVTINLNDREIYANNKYTFTFAECGIDGGEKHKALAGENAGIRRWNFEVVTVPVSTSGTLRGAHEHRLIAKLH